MASHVAHGTEEIVHTASALVSTSAIAAIARITRASTAKQSLPNDWMSLDTPLALPALPICPTLEATYLRSLDTPSSVAGAAQLPDIGSNGDSPPAKKLGHTSSAGRVSKLLTSSAETDIAVLANNRGDCFLDITESDENQLLFRRNTKQLFNVVGDKPLSASVSPFIANAWLSSLAQCPIYDLGQLLHDIFNNGARIGSVHPPAHRHKPGRSRNHPSTNQDPTEITTQIEDDLSKGRLTEVANCNKLFLSPQGLVPKHDGGWRRIHDLSYPNGASVNDTIPKEFAALRCISFETIIDCVRAAGPNAIILKRDIRAAFRNIPVASQDRWLLAFEWKGRYFHENCLPFGLRTAP